MFRSTKTLEQTTAWLQWAIERYGHVDEPPWKRDVSDVRFRGCTMEWFERQVGGSVTTESRYSVPLRDVDLQLNTIRGSSEGVRVSLANDTEVVRRYMEDGRDKGTGHDHERSVRLAVRDEDQISERNAWALIHASRLCGAPIRTEY